MLLIWRRWRGWRRGRPFWGGVFTVLAGVEIGVIPLAPMKVMLHQGPAGIPTVVLAAMVVVLGLSAWFAPSTEGSPASSPFCCPPPRWCCPTWAAS